jgi:hypothetical protein
MTHAPSSAAPVPATETVALSLILCSRNDAYMGQSRWRLETTLNSVAARLEALGVSRGAEIVVADWGSDVPLRDVLALEPAAAALVRFVTVPRALARARQGDSTFPEVLALNAAARRCRGRFIGRIDQDTIVGDRFLQWFFGPGLSSEPASYLYETAVYFANRRSIPYRLAVRAVPRRQIDRFVRVFGRRLPVWKKNPWFDDEFWTSSVGVWLVPRARWEECGGYDERMIHYNWMEADMIRRLTPQYTLVDLGVLTGQDFYHLEHVAPGSTGREHARKNPNLVPSAPPPAMAPNGPRWGLADCDLPVTRLAAPATAVPQRGGLAGVGDRLTFAAIVGRLAVDLSTDLVVRTGTSLSAVTKRRGQAVARAIAGQPVQQWPGTLWKLWQGRRTSGGTPQ